MGLVPVIDVPGPEVFELLPGRGRVHGGLASSLPLSFLQGESEQMIGYVVFIGGVELHAEVDQSLRRITGSEGGHTPRMSGALDAPISTRESGGSPKAFGEHLVAVGDDLSAAGEVEHWFLSV